MVHVLAVIELLPGSRDAFLGEFHRIQPEVLAEPGVLEYGVAVDLPTAIERQAPLRPDVATIVEKWENLAALEAHLAAPHMATYRERVKPYVKGAQLHILEPV